MIAIFAKAPVPGRVKTRLIPALGAQGAADLARAMLEDTLAAASLLNPLLCTDPEPDHPDWHGLIPTGTATMAQGDGDLGERLARVAQAVLASEPVMLIGTDCPGLTAQRLRAAWEALARHDAVIHPAHDGGYALLGLSSFHPSLFEGIAWSTAAVAADTIARVRALGWSLHIGETLQDVDEPEDLPALFKLPVKRLHR
jgi:hypothetical protein